MRRPFPPFIFILIGVSLIVLAGLLTVSPEVSPANAQCGTSASSCKTCHEVNAKHPVNNSGAWHTNHAFGDFCSFCHAGNVQAMDEKEAHQGMTDPFADPKGACASCHADDYLKKTEVYATTLGKKLGTDGGKSSGGTSASGSGTPSAGGAGTTDTSSSNGTKSSDSAGAEEKAAAAKIESKPIDPPGEKYASGSLIDYNRRYDMEVLGKLDSAQIGNLILAGIAVMLTLFGAALVWWFERSGAIQRRLAFSGASAGSSPVIPASAPVLDLPEGIEKLDQGVQIALKKLLADPEHTAAITNVLNRLDPALISNLHNLSKQDWDLLLAVVEKLRESKS